MPSLPTCPSRPDRHARLPARKAPDERHRNHSDRPEPKRLSGAHHRPWSVPPVRTRARGRRTGDRVLARLPGQPAPVRPARARACPTTSGQFDVLGWGRADKPVGYAYTATNQTGDLDAVIT